MSIKDLAEIGAYIILALGGSAGIILAFSKWIGELLSNRILEKYKFRHEKDLEAIKTKYSTELEVTKSELDKSRHLFYKYSDKQFELYNNLWKVIWNIKKQADSLWKEAESKKLPRFSKSLKDVKEALFVNILIIDESHFKKLVQIIEEFEQFNFGKQKLIELRAIRSYDEEEEEGEEVISYQTKTNIAIPEEEVKQVILMNGDLKARFDKEIMELANEFRHRIGG